MAIKKIEPIVPMIYDFIGNSMPEPTPKMSFSSGFIKDFRHNWKLTRMEKSSEREANIAEHKNRALVANLNSINEVMSFSKKFIHSMNMMDIEEKTAEANLQQIQMKNQMLFYEGKISEMEFKTREREMNKELKEDDNE